VFTIDSASKKLMEKKKEKKIINKLSLGQSPPLWGLSE
jgi:hypothetical protein